MISGASHINQNKEFTHEKRICPAGVYLSELPGTALSCDPRFPEVKGAHDAIWRKLLHPAEKSQASQRP